MEIRVATNADIHALSVLESECFPNDPWSCDALSGQIEDGWGVTLVALAQGGVCGYICGRWLMGEAEIYRVAVSPHRQRQGVGGALLDACLAHLKEKETESVYLEVRASNEAARGLYASRGFTVCGVRRQYYRHPTEDAILMKREEADHAYSGL